MVKMKTKMPNCFHLTCYVHSVIKDLDHCVEEDNETVQAQGEECCNQLVMNAMDTERGNSQEALCLFLEPDCKIYNV